MYILLTYLLSTYLLTFLSVCGPSVAFVECGQLLKRLGLSSDLQGLMISQAVSATVHTPQLTFSATSCRRRVIAVFICLDIVAKLGGQEINTVTVIVGCENFTILANCLVVPEH